MKMRRVRVVIDENAIASKDVGEIIHPVLWWGNIYESYSDYEASLAQFSRAQRLVFAMVWYETEVNNGGHDQFYRNSTGIVWEDAIAGFTEAGLPEVAEIVAESAKRMGGRPSSDQDERTRILDQSRLEFDDLDQRLFKLGANVDARILVYIRAHASDFLFDGEIERPVAQ
jgi:hypothetical protein